ncbi:MAG: hypothetical protein FJY88_02720 [Candidatus Eisenbacteria bacterium]|nr:hypothetical protein [Candidatus Eisenbacteria bacterium]
MRRRAVAVWDLRSGPCRAIVVFGLFALAVQSPCRAQPAPENPILDPAQEALAQQIFNELVSPCCWTTTVAQHGSGAAPRIQAEVRGMIAGGMGHAAIVDHYVQEYGERILAKPKKRGFNLAAYWVPYAAIAIGLAAIATVFRRRMGTARRPSDSGKEATSGAARAAPTAAGPPPAGTDEEYRRRLQEEARRLS